MVPLEKRSSLDLQLVSVARLRCRAYSNVSTKHGVATSQAHASLGVENKVTDLRGGIYLRLNLVILSQFSVVVFVAVAVTAMPPFVVRIIAVRLAAGAVIASRFVMVAFIAADPVMVAIITPLLATVAINAMPLVTSAIIAGARRSG